jgi:hypothetical protein
MPGVEPAHFVVPSLLPAANSRTDESWSPSSLFLFYFILFYIFPPTDITIRPLILSPYFQLLSFTTSTREQSPVYLIAKNRDQLRDKGYTMGSNITVLECIDKHLSEALPVCGIHRFRLHCIFDLCRRGRVGCRVTLPSHVVIQADKREGGE